LFTNQIVEILTTSEGIAVVPFGMNKPKREEMHQILNEYLEKGIDKPSLFSWNAPAFLVKNQHHPEESTPSKLWRVVEDYKQLDKAIVNDVF
jgi:hypothetical protein